MRMYDIILKKRSGEALNCDEIRFLVDGYTNGAIPDYQVSAFLMAVYFNGLNREETVCLTDCMAHSGDMVDLSCFGELSVDKHSTGGVGDKTTLIVAPIVAALGGKVTKMSGRGLGHTGGTVDKLESIPGFRTTLSREEFLDQIRRIGVAVIGQSGNLAPADKKLYALRDVTATVDNIGLITSSIMSKKLAAGSHNIVLDVKTGSGAFMKTPQDAERLAEWMVSIGRDCGRNMAALITDMDKPLGAAIGNALEVKEAVGILRGECKGDLYEVCVAIASTMLSITFAIEFENAKEKVKACIESGKAFEKLVEWVAAQGGNTDYLRDVSRFPVSEFSFDVLSPESGYITAMNAEGIGSVGVVLGAGRETKEDELDYSAGIMLHKKVGDKVQAGEKIATLYTNDSSVLDAAKDKYLRNIEFGVTSPEPKPLIYKIIQ